MDSLAQLCREKLAADPFSGCLFIFRSRSGKAIRILTYDGQGFWIATKRLSKGRFKWWPTGNEPAKTLRAHQAQLLLAAWSTPAGIQAMLPGKKDVAPIAKTGSFPNVVSLPKGHALAAWEVDGRIVVQQLP